MKKKVSNVAQKKTESEVDSSQKASKGSNYWEMRKPPNVVELGHSGWNLLHTIAAYYPEDPSIEKKSQIRTFLDAFAKVYPCSYCAKDFEAWMQENPPKLENRKEFSYWMCRVLISDFILH